MKTVGELLKAARKKQQLNLADIAKKTKISQDYLLAIEANKFNQLPPATFVKGFIQNYAKVVKVNPKTALAMFRRDFSEDKKGKIIPRSLAEPISRPSSFWTPKTTFIAVTIIIATLIAAFFTHQILRFTSAPSLTLTAPPEQATLTSPFQIEGKTQPDATVLINNQPTLVDADGNFSTSISLSEGEHIITLKATSRGDKTRTLQRTVIIIPQ